MTLAPAPARPADRVAAPAGRYRLSRAGVLNVWQYDDQVFELADGRLLLRGTNGAGKSKTLEMLLPFAIDGDKMRITASGRHHTSLLWLMTDGYEGNRTGYLWVEFARTTETGEREILTCGVGIRASSTSKSATSWYFTCPRAVGTDLHLEDDAGPLSAERLRATLGEDGHVFDQARAYKAHVGRVLFGLDVAQYDELLRLLYWLRQPQVGEDIEPAKLAEQLAQALPQVDDDAIRSAGDTFDELTAFGEQIERRQRAATAIAAFADTYRGYATAVARASGQRFLDAHRELTRRRETEAAAQRAVEARSTEHTQVTARLLETEQALTRAEARKAELEASPEARSQQRVLELGDRARELEDAARQAAEVARRADRRAAQVGDRVTDDARQLRADASRRADGVAALLADAARAGVSPVPAGPSGLAEPALDHGDDAADLQVHLDAHAAALTALQTPLGELLAAVAVVREAGRRAEQADAAREARERDAAHAERRAEEERGRREDAAEAVRVAQHRLVVALDAWQADRRGVAVELPELTATTLADLARTVQSAVGPALRRLVDEESQAAAARRDAEQRLDELSWQRAGIAAETDPAPPAPTLARSPRPEGTGAPLWRLVDFVDGMTDIESAGLEAALESSGLLDAWIEPDGSVLDAERLDVVLSADGSAAPGRTLADVLVLARDDLAVPAPVIDTVLRRVALDGDSARADAAVAVDGAWRLGPLGGRATKPAAQYVGAAARAAERERRLAEVDAQIAQTVDERDRALDVERNARARRSQLEAWLAALPPAQPLLTAWTRHDERRAAAERAQGVADEAERAAVAARTEAAGRRRDLAELAERHRLPTSASALAERRDALAALQSTAARYADETPALRRRLERWGSDWGLWRTDVADAAEQATAAEDARARALAVREQHRTLSESVGADIEELQRRLALTRSEIEQARRDRRQLDDTVGVLREQLGSARSAAEAAVARRREQEPAVVEAGQALASLADVPGLLAAALPASGTPEEPGTHDVTDAIAVLGQARGLQPGAPVPRPLLDTARLLSRLEPPPRGGDAAAVFAALQQTVSSDAADHEPRVVQVGDLLAALGRDDGGEHPVVELAARLDAGVRHDQQLLTDRERQLFEEHLVGELGEVLRRRRLEATDLVEGMNRLLAGVTTSQGIAVRLQWRLRDDVPEDARRAVDLLGRPVAALLASERTELRDALHRLIEASRAEAPEDGYAEHLARALDYRRWFAFRIRYTRPELPGRWQDLHRRSPLSQGEQKVVCYLPLFAAAAAHFTSLAGAAPHAPRFVLLDDAFPKIDVRTHPLLFGLLVDLDLDFVVTSERLWGDHATVPSLAIYEALRDPGERGIAQYHYTWDGARLQAVGA